jgi:hypothetical protein
MGGFALIPREVDIVKLPVIAAGGIADGRGVVAVPALGAEAVQIGTAFVSCVGSGASAAYRSALWSPAAKNTGLTEAFTGRLARGVRSRLMDELADVNDPALPFPLQHALIQNGCGTGLGSRTSGPYDCMGGPERRSLPLYRRYGIYEAAHCGIRCFLFRLNILFQHACDASTLKRYQLLLCKSATS